MFRPIWFSSRFQYMMCFDPLYCHKNVQVIPMCYKNVIFIFLIQFCHKISTNIFCWRFLLQAPQTRQRRLVNQNKQQMLVEILWQNWIQKNLNNNFVTQWNHSKPLLNERTEKNTSYITIWKRRKRKKNTLLYKVEIYIRTKEIRFLDCDSLETSRVLFFPTDSTTILHPFLHYGWLMLRTKQIPDPSSWFLSEKRWSTKGKSTEFSPFSSS